MKGPHVRFLLLLFCLWGSTAASKESLEELGFKRIFDGKTLKGWRAVPEDCAADWSVKKVPSSDWETQIDCAISFGRRKS